MGKNDGRRWREKRQQEPNSSGKYEVFVEIRKLCTLSKSGNCSKYIFLYSVE